MQVIVGICGRAQAGKSTLSKQLGGVNLPFAKALKDGLIAMGLPEEWIYNPQLKFKDMDLLEGHSPRYAMQTLGTEWGRDLIGPDLWVKLWANNLKKYADQPLIVVDDVRFVNEIDMLRAVGGILVAVSRPQPERRLHERLLHSVVGAKMAHNMLSFRKHRSERLRFEDYGIPILVNDGTPDELLAKFRALNDAPRGT